MAAGHKPVVYATEHRDADDRPSTRRVEVYADDGGLWRYRVKAGNGQIVGTPGQGYARKDGALRAARREHPPVPRIR
jgi:uncharacterized protein YegP (UPF0339 family)